MSFHLPTEDQILEARADLYVALLIARPDDDVQLIGHVLKALRLLGEDPPNVFDLASHTKKMAELDAMVARHVQREGHG
jgi:hypothetical protein